VEALKITLKDDDIFVVARTVEAIAELHGANMGGLRQELAAAARQNTELAQSIVHILAADPSLQPQGREVVRELCGHEEPGVRIAALEALVAAVSPLPVAEVVAGLGDEDRDVRIAAAQAAALRWDEEEFVTVSAPTGLLGTLLGGGRPRTVKREKAASKGAEELLAAVRPMASADDTEERLAALLAMAALGEPDLAFPGLEEVLTAEPDMAGQVVRAVPQLDWEKRRALFDLARRASLKEYTWSAYLSSVMSGAPRAAADYLWDVFDEDPYVTTAPEAVIRTVVEFYGADVFHGMSGEKLEPVPELAERAETRLGADDPVRQAIALVLLRRADEAKGKAAELELIGRAEGDAPAELRRVAIELALWFGDLDSSVEIGYLEDPDPTVRGAAAAAVAARVTPFSADVPIHIAGDSVYSYSLRLYGMRGNIGIAFQTGSGQAWEPPEIPEGFPVEKLESAAAGADGYLDDVVTYLRARAGDDAALEALAAEAGVRTYDDSLRFALALAVAARGRDEEIKYVRSMYDAMQDYQRTQFAVAMFTAFSHMRGPNALELRRDLLRERREAGPNWW
jgi:hypothetical protein